MKSKFLNNPFFRILFPPVYGIMVYMLVLMFFDNISQITNNFFSQELLLFVGINILLIESLRLSSNIISKRTENSRQYIILYSAISQLITVLISAGSVSVYFIYVLNSGVFTTELMVISGIYIVTTCFLCLLHFSVVLLYTKNEARMESENYIRKRLELQLQTFQNEINPEFLYSSMETLISLGYKDKKEADEFISYLSKVYRFKLDNQHNETVVLKNDLAALSDIVFILNHRFGNNIKLKSEIFAEEILFQVVPGTLGLVAEHLVKSSIINSIQQLNLIVSVDPDDDYLVVQTRLNERLINTDKEKNSLDNLRRAYALVTDKPILQVKAYGEYFVKVPLLTLETAS